ncbi:MAG: guanylate kinase [Candidatus Tokpelaia sp. JSC189]|nr:MAG: guanylate kinase [Candidatus Tokpelaia sp. JSC189]
MIPPTISYFSVNSQLKQRGLIIIISSPSGAGKSTLSRLLWEDENMNLVLSVSVTTRKRRASEVEGVHYHFISMKEFERLRDSDELIEWAEVHGNYYATLRTVVEKILEQGQDMLFDIDYQGTIQLQKKMPQDIVSIFILPPSMKELKDRLHRRAEDSKEVIRTRLENSRVEMQHWENYDYILINKDMDESLNAIASIIIAERFKRHRRPGVKKFINDLMNEKS